MIDEHLTPVAQWGIRPILFRVGELAVPAYGFFVALGLLLGIGLFTILIRGHSKDRGRHAPVIAVSALVGGVIGAKLPLWILNAPQIWAAFPDMSPFLSGRTIVGGVIGGMLAVTYVKTLLGEKHRFGNAFAPALALGLVVGRIGCFLQGCCYGTETVLPWGVNFGDGVLRHPTQMYEALLGLGLLAAFFSMGRRHAREGLYFDIFLIAYFGFRFLEEFLREGHALYFGFSGYQWGALLVLTFVSVRLKRARLFTCPDAEGRQAL